MPVKHPPHLRRIVTAGALILGCAGGTVTANAATAAMNTHQAAAGDQHATLRVCYDPDDAPFSVKKANAVGTGAYVELGRELAARLGRTFEPVWVPPGSRLRWPGRKVMLSGGCNAVIGWPDTAGDNTGSTRLSSPLFEVGFSFVAPKGTIPPNIEAMRGKKLAVQFLTPPDIALSSDTAYHLTTVPNPAEGMKVLAEGKVNAAVIWGPSAGYENARKYDGRFAVVPVSGQDEYFKAAILFPAREEALRNRVDDVLAHMKPELEAITARYHFPHGQPIRLPDQQASLSPAQRMVRAAAWNPAGTAALLRKVDDAIPKGNAKAGAGLFDSNCSHCHGPGANTAIRSQNLRYLAKDFGGPAGMDKRFWYVVHHGIPSKGMPNWTGGLTDQQLADILAWLHTRQIS